MRRMIIIPALAAAGMALALGACASQPKGKQLAQQKKTHMVCFSAIPTGTHIAKTYCMTEENYAYYKKLQQKGRKADQSQLLQMTTDANHAAMRENTPSGAGGGGG